MLALARPKMDIVDVCFFLLPLRLDFKVCRDPHDDFLPRREVCITLIGLRSKTVKKVQYFCIYLRAELTCYFLFTDP